MKKVIKTWILISSITVCALGYVALQNELYHVSYSIQKKKRQLSVANDQFERTRVRLLKLKALDILEQRMEAANVPLSLPQEVKVIQLPYYPHPDTHPIETGKSSFSILQFVREAHAKIISPGKE
jgi:hypothetical protein